MADALSESFALVIKAADGNKRGKSRRFAWQHLANKQEIAYNAFLICKCPQIRWNMSYLRERYFCS